MAERTQIRSDQAAALAENPALVRALANMRETHWNKARGIDLADPNACRGYVAAIQAQQAFADDLAREAGAAEVELRNAQRARRVV